VKPLIQYPGELMHPWFASNPYSPLWFRSFLPVSLRVRFVESAVKQAFLSPSIARAPSKADGPPRDFRLLLTDRKITRGAMQHSKRALSLKDKEFREYFLRLRSNG
jgi:hypothetical protein